MSSRSHMAEEAASELLPRELEAERAVLGSILLDNEILPQAAKLLEPDDFYLRLHRDVFIAMLALGSHIDNVTIENQLSTSGRKLDSEEIAAIGRFADGLPRSSNIAPYAQIVKDAALRRGLARLGENILQAAREKRGPVDKIVQRARARLDELNRPTTEEPRPVVWESTDFLAAEFPPREPLAIVETYATPIFTKQSINEVFAKRGTGKSLLALSLAGQFSVAGALLNWKVTRPLSVLYVDGELPNAQIQERMRALNPTGARFRLISLDSQAPNSIPSLCTQEGQRWLEPELVGIDVLFLDSVASLAPFATNEEELWLPFNIWLTKLRSRGLCIIRLAQAGRAGGQRGHSRSEDPLDVQIKLESDEAEESDHCHCKLLWAKFRGRRDGVHSLEIECHAGQWSTRFSRKKSSSSSRNTCAFIRLPVPVRSPNKFRKSAAPPPFSDSCAN